MKFQSRILVIIIAAIAVGCAAKPPSAKIPGPSGPFVTSAHETFVQKESGETGLHIDGENWYVLIDLKGFEDVKKEFVSPYQFLFQGNDEGVTLSAFAEKIEGIKDSASCLNSSFPESAQQKSPTTPRGGGLMKAPKGGQLSYERV